MTAQEVILVGGLVKNTFSNQNRLSAVALRCLLDIGKAASTINMKGEIPIRGLAFDLAHEVKVEKYLLHLELVLICRGSFRMRY
jgi:hypothetical protein